MVEVYHFPSFSEGLSLRVPAGVSFLYASLFPFLFGGAFIEGVVSRRSNGAVRPFPLLFRRGFH